MSEDDPGRLKRIVLGLAVIYVMTFFSGFLQDTQYNFVNYVLFSLLFVGGIVLLTGTVKSTQPRTARGFWLLTGTSTTLLLILGIGYEWFRLDGNRGLEASMEGLLYLTTLFFWIGVLGSLMSIGRMGDRHSSQS